MPLSYTANLLSNSIRGLTAEDDDPLGVVDVRLYDDVDAVGDLLRGERSIDDNLFVLLFHIFFTFLKGSLI